MMRLIPLGVSPARQFPRSSWAKTVLTEPCEPNNALVCETSTKRAENWNDAALSPQFHAAPWRLPTAVSMSSDCSYGTRRAGHRAVFASRVLDRIELRDERLVAMPLDWYSDPKSALLGMETWLG